MNRRRTNKPNKNGQTWQACQHSKVVQKGPKGSQMVNLDVFDNLGPFFFKSTSAKPYFVLMGQKIDFCLKWSKKVQMDPKGSQMVKNHSGRPFWSLLEYFIQACHFWSIMDHFLADPSQERWTYPSLL